MANIGQEKLLHVHKPPSISHSSDDLFIEETSGGNAVVMDYALDSFSSKKLKQFSQGKVRVIEKPGVVEAYTINLVSCGNSGPQGGEDSSSIKLMATSKHSEERIRNFPTEILVMPSQQYKNDFTAPSVLVKRVIFFKQESFKHTYPLDFFNQVDSSHIRSIAVGERMYTNIVMFVIDTLPTKCYLADENNNCDCNDVVGALLSTVKGNEEKQINKKQVKEKEIVDCLDGIAAEPLDGFAPDPSCDVPPNRRIEKVHVCMFCGNSVTGGIGCGKVCDEVLKYHVTKRFLAKTAAEKVDMKSIQEKQQPKQVKVSEKKIQYFGSTSDVNLPKKEKKSKFAKLCSCTKRNKKDSKLHQTKTTKTTIKSKSGSKMSIKNLFKSGKQTLMRKSNTQLLEKFKTQQTEQKVPVTTKSGTRILEETHVLPTTKSGTKMVEETQVLDTKSGTHITEDAKVLLSKSGTRILEDRKLTVKKLPEEEHPEYACYKPCFMKDEDFITKGENKEPTIEETSTTCPDNIFICRPMALAATDTQNSPKSSTSEICASLQPRKCEPEPDPCEPSPPCKRSGQPPAKPCKKTMKKPAERKKLVCKPICKPSCQPYECKSIDLSCMQSSKEKPCKPKAEPPCKSVAPRPCKKVLKPPPPPPCKKVSKPPPPKKICKPPPKAEPKKGKCKPKLPVWQPVCKPIYKPIYKHVCQPTYTHVCPPIYPQVCQPVCKLRSKSHKCRYVCTIDSSCEEDSKEVTKQDGHAIDSTNTSQCFIYQSDYSGDEYYDDEDNEYDGDNTHIVGRIEVSTPYNYGNYPSSGNVGNADAKGKLNSLQTFSSSTNTKLAHRRHTSSTNSNVSYLSVRRYKRTVFPRCPGGCRTCYSLVCRYGQRRGVLSYSFQASKPPTVLKRRGINLRSLLKKKRHRKPTNSS